MRQSEILIAYSKLTRNQKDRIERIVRDYVSMNHQLKDENPDICPVCGEEHPKLIKKGFVGKDHKKQRFLHVSPNCNHKFVYDSKTITSWMKIGKDEFLEICMDTLNLVSIKTTAARLNRSINCVFENRHKFLCLLEEILKKEKTVVDGTVEIDGTYILESQKGSKEITRKARYRGGRSNFRGISHELTCIVTTTDRNQHEIFRAVSQGRPTTDIITKEFGSRIGKQSVLYTDGIQVYNEIARINKCEIKYLEGYESYNKVEHLNTVNSIHSMIDETIEKYRGIATKYMNRYASLFVFIRRYMEMDDNEKIENLIGKLKWFHCTIRRYSLKDSHLFACTL